MSRAKGPLPPALFLAALGVEVVLNYALPTGNVIADSVRPLGLLFLIGGMALAIAADGQFKRVRTEINPFGRPSVLVSGGAFRLSRNPMYLGLSLALVGVALLLGSAPALAIPPLFAWLLTVRFIQHEERTMAERFGAEYEAYTRRVRRWI